MEVIFFMVNFMRPFQIFDINFRSTRRKSTGSAFIFRFLIPVIRKNSFVPFLSSLFLSFFFRFGSKV